VWVGCSGPPFALPLRVPCLLGVGVWVLVGLLFEICIVDASIFQQLAQPVFLGVGLVVGVCNFCVFASFCMSCL